MIHANARLFLFFLFIFPFTTSAQQTMSLHDEATSIVLSGGSTFHDWQMPLQDGHSQGSASFAFREDTLARLTDLEVRIEAEGLKSDSKGMNKDAYRALNTDRFPYITFRLKEPAQLTKKKEAFFVDGEGDLTISGVTKTIVLRAACSIGRERKVTCEGTYSLNMLDYGVNPPKTMLGLVKAEKEVTVTYKAVFVP